MAATATMLISLTDPSASSPAAVSPATVGGKASSLARLYAIPALRSDDGGGDVKDKVRHRVPRSFALSVEFFAPWIAALVSEEDGDYARMARLVREGSKDEEAARSASDRLKRACETTPLNASQQSALDALSAIISSEFDRGLAAVRSSGVEEDGSEQSYAGMFETRLGVTPGGLEGAVRECFASKFDYRVLSYAVSNSPPASGGGDGGGAGGFACVVMEMIDSAVAGVAFSANPLNSDRDECVVDSSYGLGESVVDGSVTADRYVYDKVDNKVVQKTIGSKRVERRLNFAEGGGVMVKDIADEERANASSLSDEQLQELVRLTCIVEEEYGMPMDVEWAYTDDGNLVLLQSRPITTLFCLDDRMMTKPGERRVLYYDFNIASEATTTTPFRHMDLAIYCRLTNLLGGLELLVWPTDPSMPMFNASTRQYVNLSIFLKYLTPKRLSRESKMLDPYLSSLFASKDCDRARYRAKSLPKGVNLKNTWWLVKQFPLREYLKHSRRFKKDPEKAKEEYLHIWKEDLSNLNELKERGYRKEEGMQRYCDDLFRALNHSVNQEMSLIMFIVLGLFRQLDRERREGKTEEIRNDADALCGGYEGDELMKINIGVFNLANKLDRSIWDEYEHDQLPSLAGRIEANLDGTLSDLPKDFLSEWKSFMDKFGWDGEDQLFISSPRYQDDPALLLARLRPNVGSGIADPSVSLREKVVKRRQVAKSHEERAASKRFTSQSKVRKRNAYLEHLMWIRNSPKIHLSAMMGILRAEILRVERDFVEARRLDAKNDIFHLTLEEVDEALSDESYDLRKLVMPRKALFERAVQARECPLLIDSRCRILRPDPPSLEDAEEGVIVGSAVSPGVATGRVRIMTSPTERFERGEVLAATVTSPAWTPLFAGASAVILQIGGALQHGALCAREFGKPAVSNVDIHNVLKTGMIVTVDGNTGTVTITDETT